MQPGQSISDRAEQIAAHLIRDRLHAEVVPNAPGHPMDFSLRWPDRAGVLEVTLVAPEGALQWQNQLAREGGRWPSSGRWEYRLHGDAMPYRAVRAAVMALVEFCDEEDADESRAWQEADGALRSQVALVEAHGELRRIQYGAAGVSVYGATRAEFIGAAPGDFSEVVDAWAQLPHVARHIAKTAEQTVDERHLFLVPVDDVLPAKFFTDDFDLPRGGLTQYATVDAVWVWSNFWHRYLEWRDSGWTWCDFPRERDADKRRHTDAG